MAMRNRGTTVHNCLLGLPYDVCNYSHAVHVTEMMGREYNDLPSHPCAFLAVTRVEGEECF
jgi:hypothetical protein